MRDDGRGRKEERGIIIKKATEGVHSSDAPLCEQRAQVTGVTHAAEIYGLAH